MRRTVVLLTLVGSFLLSTQVFGAYRQVKTAPKHGIGFGFDAAYVDIDNPFTDNLRFSGWTVYGKVGITQNWGVLISGRDVNDDEDLILGERDSYTQLGTWAVYMWNPGAPVRPHVKGGLAYTDFEAEIPGLPKISDNEIGFSMGGGLELGSPRVAFFGDWDLTFTDLFGDRFVFSNLTLGIMFKF